MSIALLEDLKNPLGNVIRTFGVAGYNTVSIQIAGTISAGSYTPQVSLDGATFVNMPAITTAGAAAATLTATGIYWVDVKGCNVFRLNTTDAAGSHTVNLYASPEMMTTRLV